MSDLTTPTGLCDRALLSKVEYCKFNGVSLATKYQFHVCHIGQEKSDAMCQKNSMFAKERGKILHLLEKSFNHTTAEDKEAIINSINNGQALYVIGFGNNLDVNHIIAVVLYVLTEEGCYINWLAVTNS